MTAKPLTEEQKRVRHERAVRAGKRSKAKGSSFERDIVHRFRELAPEARRGIGQARTAGEVCDVEGTPYWLECKHRKQIDLEEAIQQADRDTDGRLPIVVYRVNGTRSLMVAMRAPVFLRLIDVLNGRGLLPLGLRSIAEVSYRATDALPEIDPMIVRVSFDAFLLLALAVKRKTRYGG